MGGSLRWRYRDFGPSYYKRGHPTKADLECGIGKKRGLPGSEHNQWKEQGKEKVACMSEPIKFYRASGPYGWLSNLYPCPMLFAGQMFQCAEYAYQVGKPNNQEIAQWLADAPTPSLCAQAAHALFPWQVQSDWASSKLDRMRAVLRAKFEQHWTLQVKLFETDTSTLIEESSMDAFWGIGKKGNGKNMLGKMLMELRDQLRAEREP